MKKLLLVLLCLSVAAAADFFSSDAVSAEEPIVVVTPPPGGPIPIPYPNAGATSPTGRSALTGFLRAQVGTGGIISIRTDDTIE